jgi:DNA-binding MarR family transcriptional regulator
MQEYVGLLIAIARRRIKQAVLRRVARHRLAPQQFWILIALSETPGVSQSELAEQVHIDAPTASRIITALSGRELVRIELDPRDRRRSRLFLTGAGERLARELATLAQSVRAAVVDDMSEAEVEALRRGLRKVICNMDRFEARASRRRTTS